MARAPFLGRAIAAIALCCAMAGPAGALELPPFKDRLFGYPGTFIEDDGGHYSMVDYDETRDINGRDEVPERRVSAQYVSLGVNRQQRDLSVRTQTGNVDHFAVGPTRNARLIVLYLHGRGGNRNQGVNDYSFGGNFNRIKNLAVEAGGLYLVPDFPDFDRKGAAHVASLIHHYSAASPGAPVVVACGSMGGSLCWWLARDRRIAEKLGGLMLLGSLWDNAFLQSPAFELRVPVFLGHGSSDRVFPIDRHEEFYRRVRSQSPAYPIRLVRFETGGHGTPIRMTDWRREVNWLLAR